MDLAELRSEVATALDTEVVSASAVSGGDVAESYRLQLDSGQVVFAKTHRDPPPDFFHTEADGLRWLGEPGIVRVPDVLAVGANHLVSGMGHRGRRRSVDRSRPGSCPGPAARRGGTRVRPDRPTNHWGAEVCPTSPTTTGPTTTATTGCARSPALWRRTGHLDPAGADRLERVAERLGDPGRGQRATRPSARRLVGPATVWSITTARVG